LFETIFQAIQAYNRIILHRHKKPDGDAIGSQVGLKHILKANFPEKEIYVVGDSAGFYGFVEVGADVGGSVRGGLGFRFNTKK
jgi:phosphoesterase RecJ-like protein